MADLSIVERLQRLVASKDRSNRKPGPLEGVNVLDLSRVVAAPFAAMALGEMGATVLKIERAGKGDDSRAWGPPFFEGQSPYFLAVNANKLSVEANLSGKQGQALVLDLVRNWADVVLENFKDGNLEQWNLGLDDLRGANPRLITGSVRGYPLGDSRPGYDFITQSETGLMSLAGLPEGPPVRTPISISDLSTGQFLLSGILGALYERERSGRGQHVEVSLWESQVALLTNVAQSYLMSGDAPERMGNSHPHIEPYGVYPCRDGVVSLAATNDAQYDSLVRALGSPPSLLDPKFASNPLRVKHRVELSEQLAQKTATMGREGLLAALRDEGIACGPVLTVPEVFESHEAKLSQIVQHLPHSLCGTVPNLRLPWVFSRTPSNPRWGAPGLGEHNHLLQPALSEA